MLRYFCTASCYCLQIWKENFFNPADPGIFEEQIYFDLFVPAVALQSFEGHIHADFFPELEAVCQCFFRPIYLDRDIVYQMLFDPDFI